MNDLIKNETMTSLEIAEVTGKEHKNVMRDIRNILDQGVNELNFEPVEYKDKKGESRPMYQLTKKGCMILASGYDALLREKIINRWEELETNARKNELIIPNFSNPAEAARAWADQYEKRLALEADKKRLEADNNKKDTEIVSLSNTVAEMKPKVTYVDMILSSKETVTTTQIGQDYGMSATKFNILLRNFGIQHKVGGQWILYSKYLPFGYIQSETHSFPHKDGSIGTAMYSKWTQKGRLFLYEELKRRGVLPLIERTNDENKQ